MPSMKTTAPGWNPLPLIFSGVLPPVEPVSGRERLIAGAEGGSAATGACEALPCGRTAAGGWSCRRKPQERQ